MNMQKDLTNFQKFLLWFLLISASITIISFLIFAVWYPESILIYTIIIYPFILSSIEGIVGTYFYFENRRKVTWCSVVYLIIPIIIGIYFHYFVTPLEEQFVYEDILFTGIIWFLAGVFYFMGENYSSTFISRFLSPFTPNRDDLKLNLLTYKFENKEIDDIDRGFNWLSYEVFNYNKELKKNKKEGYIDYFLQNGNSNEYIFFEITENKIIMLPLILSDYRKYSCNIEERKIIQGYLSVFSNMDPIAINNHELTEIEDHFKDIIKPSKDKLNKIKSIILPCFVTVFILSIVISFILRIEDIMSLFRSLNSIYIFTGIIIAVVSSLLTMFISGGYKKIGEIFNRKSRKK